MNTDHIPTPEEKLWMLGSQLDTIHLMGPVSIKCPYCFGVTPPGGDFCCPTIILALTALADARDKFGYMRK